MNDDDEQLRRLFHDATADIRPQGSLEDIRNRAEKVDPMARRWFLPAMTAAAVMALVIGGAFWMTRDTGGNDDTGPASTPTVSAPVDATIYYVGDGATGPRLFRETHRVTPVDGSAGLAAAKEAVGGTPVDRDYRTGWPTGLSLEGVSYDGSTISVDFADGAAADPSRRMEPADARAAVNALVRTVQDAFDTKAPVAFSIADEAAPRILGVDTSAPQTGGNDDDVLALVSISDLVDGATVPAGKLTVKGLANAFEANVSWEILVGGDAVIDSGFATASECCRLAPFEFTTNIALEGPGTYTLVVRDNDESGEGRPVNRDSKEIVVE